MLVTFPHMGSAYVTLKALLEDLGVDVLVPPPCTKRTLELGTKYAPELACLPLKINIGNYIESLEKGADTIVMAGGCGPCRFGYYAEVQREILKDLGYRFEMVVLERPQGNVRDFIDRISLLTGGKSIFRVISAIKRATGVSIEMDNLERLGWEVRPREIKKGSASSLMKSFHSEVHGVKGTREINSLIRDYRRRMEQVETADEDILKIGIVGEIYTVIEPFVSIGIAEKLGDLGVEVDKSITLSYWIVNHLIKEALHMHDKREIEEAAKPYLKNFVGGHGQESIANTVIYKKKCYDGVIQLLPFTCMPEIVAQSILPRVSHDHDIPAMTLVLDEMTGEAGYLTRLEAFVDLIKRKKEMARDHEKKLLSRG
ncbi:MAG: Activator of (R)-2-hydroxyglutaryl-CoA dehydratase [Firmicutes bacterium]|nr:Activator of (R)-2-hydroxyglutaryl-CoA dehydratase [Bacillota bacterium]MDI6705288.1 acyl-CoA dehydratase activase-related protein [Bacillota bacterium]